MRRRDLFGRRRLVLVAAVFLCLSLMASGSRASAPPEQELSAAAPSPVATQSMPMASDYRLCYVAPAPNAHSYTGESKEPDPPVWWVRMEPIPSTVRFLGTRNSHIPVPIRIVLCRSLD